MTPREEYESYVLSRTSDDDVRIYFFVVYVLHN